MTGVLPSQDLKTMIKEGVINAQPQIIAEQIQPASLDLRLGTRAYRVRASFLSGENQTVSSRLAEFQMHEIDLHQGAVLEKGCVYVVPLMEQLDLPAGTHAVTNAKSSTGRLDLLTRTISDYSTEFDRIAPGYRGPLYAEICPRSFSVLVRPGMRLNQIRFRAGQAILTDAELDALHKAERLVSGEAVIGDGLGFSVDLQPDGTDLVGFRAKPHTGVIDLDCKSHYDPRRIFGKRFARPVDRSFSIPGLFIFWSVKKPCIFHPPMRRKWRLIWRWLANFAFITQASLIPGLVITLRAAADRAECLKCAVTKRLSCLSTVRWWAVWSMSVCAPSRISFMARASRQTIRVKVSN